MSILRSVNWDYVGTLLWGLGMGGVLATQYLQAGGQTRTALLAASLLALAGLFLTYRDRILVSPEQRTTGGGQR